MKFKVGDKVNLVNSLLAKPVAESRALYKGEIAAYAITEKECKYFGYEYKPPNIIISEIRDDGTIIVASNHFRTNKDEVHYWIMPKEFLELSNVS